MRIAIIGSGYVGLVTGACFAEFGHFVTCIDNDQVKINGLNRGIVPIYEPGLEALLHQGQKSGRIQFTSDLTAAVKDIDAVFLAVGTPSDPETGAANLDYIFEAAKQVAMTLNHYCVIVTKSTVPVGTGRRIEAVMRAANPTLSFDMASNPEFLREGAAINDFMRPDRVVIGAESERARQVLKQLYSPLYLIETPIVFTGLETAEIIKYAANAFLATKVAFINEMADICEKAGGNVQDVAKAIGLDKRIGSKFLHAGPGFGGSCFPKDTKALAYTAAQFGTPTKIVEAVVTANDMRKKAMAKKIISAMGKSVEGKVIVILGLTFKPNTDDMRDAPSLTIIPELQRAGALIRAYDPVGMEQAKAQFSEIDYGVDPYAIAQDADAIVILTEWNEFRAMNLEALAKVMNEKLFIDLRNVYNAPEVIAAGFDYISVGRPNQLCVNDGVQRIKRVV